MKARITLLAAVSIAVAALGDAAPRAATPPASSEALVQAELDTRKDLDATLQELSALRETIRAERIPMTKELGRLEAELAQLRRAEDLVGGARYDGAAVDPAGTVHQGSFLMVGPVVLFGEPGGANPGLALAQAGSELAAVRPIEAGFSAGLTSLLSVGTGTLPLDPTRGGALQELVKRGSLIHYFKRGGPIMWPLLFVSILALTVILERLVFLAREGKRRDPETVEGIMERIEAGDVTGAIRVGDGSRDFVARTLTYAIRHREKSLTNGLMRASGLELVRFTRGISILDTCVTMAPLLGLLGTVTGMMGSFGMLGGAELSAPAQITGGIAEALIATAFGLGIAVTALIPMNYLHSRAEAARHEMEDAATHLELLMKPVQDAEGALTRERLVLKLSREAATA